MARITPTPGQKILYFVLVSLGVGILYLDINTNSFQEIKHGYKSLKISSVYIVKNISIEPLRRVLNLTKSKKTLLEENKNLKKALDASYLNNYLPFLAPYLDLLCFLPATPDVSRVPLTV